MFGGLLAAVFACNDDEDVSVQVDAGTISGGPFSFVVDGVPDFVTGVSTDGLGVGSSASWVITDDQNVILGLPGTLEMLEGVNFDGAGVGTCFIWYLRYEGEITGLTAGANTSGITGDFDLSNSIEVDRTALNGGTLAGGPFNFDVDGTADMVSGITLTGESTTVNSTFVVTDDQGEILGLPGTLTDLEGVNFDGAGIGLCLIYHLVHADGITGLAMGSNVKTGLVGDFALSNALEVNRNITGGIITGGPFTFAVDGTADMVSGISASGFTSGVNTTWVITDAQGEILGLPATTADLEGVNFDGAGVGVCLIYHLAYQSGITGLMAGSNIDTGLQGTFDFSNSITVNRN